ncbi:MAG: hypothetical protein INR71_08325, partial [Terriglobus roseus]|nr:hypothetical protein [Terriglobus roseus]
MFRRFDDPSTAATAADSDPDTDPTSTGSIIRRSAGAAARGRFTRSSVAPRLLFPNAEQQREREERARREEEEAITDIEFPDAESPEDTYFHSDEVVNGELGTPPPRNSGASKAQSVIQKVHEPMMAVDNTDVVIAVNPDADAQAPAPKSRKAKSSPFDSWRRTKSAAVAGSPAKGTKRDREGEHLEAGNASSGKRIRSGQ